MNITHEVMKNLIFQK